MSTDLHLHHELPKLRVSSADKMDKAPSSDQTTYDDEDKVSSIITELPNQTENEENDGGTLTDDESYRTPTSKESKIPEILTCPPAPKKPKPFISCKRKLMDEFQFFEVNNTEDMDAFFRSTFPKRTCPCT